MAKTPKYLDDGFTALTPYLRIKGAKAAIAFYTKVFGAKAGTIIHMGENVIGHAELTIDGAKLCLSEEFADMGILGPKTIGRTSVTIMHYTPDVDAVMARAKAAGATVTRPPVDEFYGCRTGQIEDPFGHVWMIQTKIEEVSEAEMQKRLNAMMAQGAPAAKAPAKAKAKKNA